ncbi:MAG: hypothetical protein ACHQT9_04350 [Candidatus Saccharimonadales bacterium]
MNRVPGPNFGENIYFAPDEPYGGGFSDAENDDPDRYLSDPEHAGEGGDPGTEELERLLSDPALSILGELAVDKEESRERAKTSLPFTDMVSSRIEEFMADLHGSNRYTSHNDRILRYYERYSEEEDGNQDPNTVLIDKLTFLVHDFVEHAGVNPEHTARKTEKDVERVRSDAMTCINQILEDAAELDEEAFIEDPDTHVNNVDAFTKALLFAIDASKWESAARIWRDSARTRVKEDEEMRLKELDERYEAGEINRKVYSKTKRDIKRHNRELLAAVNNDKPKLAKIGEKRLERVLRRKESIFVDLKLEAISVGTLNHNVRGVFYKAIETLDNITNPPGNSPSTWRDCTEALNFFVPALQMLGYKRLASDLRGAALKWLYDDPGGHAKSQYDVSKEYFPEIKEKVFSYLDENTAGIDKEVESRVKTEGSLREKLASDDYKHLHLVPDGVGFAVIIPDDMAGAELSMFSHNMIKAFTEDDRYSIGHPRGIDEAIDDMQGERKRKSGYEAFHIALFFRPNGPGTEPIVPTEIQVLTRTNHRDKLYGSYSDIFYKLGTEYQESDQAHLDHMAERGEGERVLAPGSTIQSIAELVKVFPNVPTIYSRLFGTIDNKSGGRILAPRELRLALSRIKPDLHEGKDTLAVLPATKLTMAEFNASLSLLEAGIPEDANIKMALNYLRQESMLLRDDGETSVLEGHILPTALSAVMLAVQSGQIWRLGNRDPLENISNIATIALLHDYVEDMLHNITDIDEKIVKRDEMLFDIKQKFGETIKQSVESMTLPFEIEDEYERREVYTSNIRDNEYARYIKPADRWQNHMTDIAVLDSIEGKTDDASIELRNKKLSYFLKTDTHLSKLFMAEDMPDVYKRVHRIIWQIARNYGYDEAK